MSPLRLATRRSALALWQAQHVAALLRQAHPGLPVELVPLSTRGDELLDRPLASLGGKGLFLKELQQAMLDGRADLAVHSLKDVPAVPESGFTLAAILRRADAADAVVSPAWGNLDRLPEGARVGTSSLRRQAQLRAFRPDLELVDLRGNINTRLARLDAGDYQAILLACAGLERLDLAGRIDQRLAPPQWLPGVGQGAIAIEGLADDTRWQPWLACLHDADTATCVSAERALNQSLAGDCTVPIGAWAQLDGHGGLDLYGMVGDAGSGRVLRVQVHGAAADPQALGEQAAQALRAQGAEQLLAGQGKR